MQRAVATATLSFGLLHIPGKVFLAGSKTRTPFHWLSPHLHRIRLPCVDRETGEDVPRESLQRGVEVEKDKYVAFTPAEWETVCGSKRNLIEIRECISPSHLSYHNICKPYCLLPDRSDKAYHVLRVGMMRAKKVIICQWYTRQGIDYLVVVYPTSTYIMMARVFYPDELRQIKSPLAKGVKPTSKEVRLAVSLLAKLAAPRGNLTPYRSEYEQRLASLVESKRASSTDLENLLQKSIKKSKRRP